MTTATAPATKLLLELTSRGIELQAHGHRLRYRPRSALTPDLADRIKAHRSALLAILAGNPRSPERPQKAAESPEDGCNARPRTETSPDAEEWPMICADTPPAVASLAAPHPGWTPDRWRNRLQQLANACESANPARASELREAVRFLQNQGIRQA